MLGFLMFLTFFVLTYLCLHLFFEITERLLISVNKLSA